MNVSEVNDVFVEKNDRVLEIVHTSVSTVLVLQDERVAYLSSSVQNHVPACRHAQFVKQRYASDPL